MLDKPELIYTFWEACGASTRAGSDLPPQARGRREAVDDRMRRRFTPVIVHYYCDNHGDKGGKDMAGVSTVTPHVGVAGAGA